MVLLPVFQQTRHTRQVPFLFCSISIHPLLCVDPLDSFRLIEEIDQALPDNREPQYEDLQNLVFLEAVGGINTTFHHELTS